MEKQLDRDGLHVAAQGNRRVFDTVLAPYVRCKLEQLQDQRERGVRDDWFDASGCVWCLFDDPAFERTGDVASRMRECDPAGFDLQVFWSLGDVVMPADCDQDWVATRIAKEAQAQLEAQGLACRAEERLVEGELHQGLALGRRRGLLERWRHLRSSS